MLVYLLLAAVVGSLAAPQGSPDAPHDAVAVDAGPRQPIVEIVQQDSIINADGTFNHSYEAANGIKVEESGFIKKNTAQVEARSGAAGADDAADGEDNGDINVIQGSYSYTAPDGTLISLRYIADELGFRPVGDHLPTPPPVPAYIARLLDAQPQDAAQVGAAAQPAAAGRAPEPQIAQVQEPTAPENIFSQ